LLVVERKEDDSVKKTEGYGREGGQPLLGSMLHHWWEAAGSAVGSRLVEESGWPVEDG
jgi:hypothetical protein